MSTTSEVRAVTKTALEAAHAAHAAALALPDDPPAPGSPVDPPAPARAPRFGLYPGAEIRDPLTRKPVWPGKILAFETQTGIDVEQVGGNQDQRYDGARGSVTGVCASEAPVPTLCLAIQLAFTDGPYGDTQGKRDGAVKRAALAATIAGRNDDIYAANVKALAASPFERIILRLGSEGDIPWPPHSFAPGTERNARANDDLYREAWAYVGGRFRADLGSRVRLSYTCTMFASSKTYVCHDGKERSALEAGWPGDDLVDIVGIDCYLGEPFARVKTLATGCLTFAERKRKPAAFDEWGITPDGHKQPAADQCAFMAWIADAPVEYASFFAGWAMSKFPDDYAPAARKCLQDAWK